MLRGGAVAFSDILRAGRCRRLVRGVSHQALGLVGPLWCSAVIVASAFDGALMSRGPYVMVAPASSRQLMAPGKSSSNESWTDA